jgi:hypothetical protein
MRCPLKNGRQLWTPRRTRPRTMGSTSDRPAGGLARLKSFKPLRVNEVDLIERITNNMRY